MSIWPRRRPALPAYARAWLDADERVLTFAATPYDDLVVATPRGLWVAEHRAATTGDGTDGPAGRLLPWEFVVTAKWEDESLTVTAAEEVAPQIMKRIRPLTFPLPEPADLPRVVRQRVERSVAASHRRALGNGRSVLLVGRRVSGRDGLLWYAVFDRDSDADDHRARQQAVALLHAAAAATSQQRAPDTV